MTPHMKLDEKALREILDGCEGVTPGPWYAQDVSLQPDDIGSAYIVGANLGGLVGAAHAWPTEIDDGDFERVVENAAHIARLDPQTVASIVTELLELRAHAPQGGVRVKELSWKYYPATNVGVEEWVASGACEFHAIVQRYGEGWHLLGSPEVGDLDGRKAAAQADYEARILAALTGSDPQ